MLVNSLLMRDIFFRLGSVQSSVNEVNPQVTQVETLLSSVEPSSPIYTSLTSIKSIMEELANALSAYLALLQMRRNRFKRASGTVKIILMLYKL